MGKKLNSMRFRLTIAFTAIILLFVLCVWAANDRFLEVYYQNYKVSLLQDAYTKIDAAVRKASSRAGTSSGDSEESGENTGVRGVIDDEELAETVQQLRDTSNITVLIYDSLRGETLVSSTTDARMLQDRVQRYILGQYPPHLETLLETSNYTIQKSEDRRGRQSYLESWGYFTDNGTVFIMSVPMDSIREAARISNRFLMYVGLIAAAAGALLISVITGYFTRPVNELSAISERMSQLDFEAKYRSTGHAATEIETLGSSMNVLSDRLNRAIGDLRLANEQLQKDIDEKVKIDEMRKEF
nr:HAMP domain-containing protein [Clostridium sp.]